MVVFWAINGFAQAFIYPPLMRITAYYLSEERYAKACLFITIGSHVATLLMYLVTPMIISVSSWKTVFVFSFFFTMGFVIIWMFYAKSVKKNYGSPTERLNKADETASDTVVSSMPALLKSSGLILIMIAVVMQGFLRDGITTWMPAYLSDVFSLSTESSIFTTVIIPVFSIFSAYIILAVRSKACHNELKLAGFTFLTAVGTIVLLLLFRTNMPLSVLLMAITSSCSHAVNFLLICLVPTKFEKYGKFSLVTGLVNSCTYVGAAISTYGFAAVSESYGWNITLILWGLIAFTGFMCCIAALKRWNKFVDDVNCF